MENIIMLILGVFISVVGIVNIKGNISTIHSYNRRKVKEENLKRVKNWNYCRAFLQNAFPGGGFGTDMVE